MNSDSQELRERRIEDCRDIYLKHDGQDHELIEKKMRELGHRDFHRRSLYRRFERGTSRAGWIETYGWDRLVRDAETRRCEDAKEEFIADNADSADKDRDHLNCPDLCHLLPSAAKNPPPVIPLIDFDEFKQWLKRVSPSMKWEWKHQVYIYKYLKRVSDGLCKRLMIFLPPRHGKSELVTVRYSAWCLKQDPKLNIILGSYNQRLANRFSRKIRRVLTDDAALSEPPAVAGGLTSDPLQVYAKKSSDVGSVNCQFSPKAQLQPPATAGDFAFTYRRANSEAEWETSAGGGIRAVGVGGGVTGFGAGLIIIDDPVKSRAEAESQTYRDNIWDWFNDDLYTRLEPNGAIILIQTRWHEDDLAGRLLREAAEEGGEQWEVVNLPALAEGDNDALGRKPDVALCPERYNEEALENLRRKLGSYSFASLYQQRPVPAEGGLFKREWFKHIISVAPFGLRWCRGYDLAMSTTANSDYTASLRVALDEQSNMYIDGGFRKRIEYPEQRKYILGRIQSERDTEHGVELSANGTAVVQDLLRERNILGRAFRGIRVEGTKISRAVSWIAIAEEGKLFLVRGAWNTEFIDEACSFPSGTHDDQIDAVSIAVRMCRSHAKRAFGF